MEDPNKQGEEPNKKISFTQKIKAILIRFSKRAINSLSIPYFAAATIILI
jgi:hypothetical protein